jgi:hypothetical protein
MEVSGLVAGGTVAAVQRDRELWAGAPAWVLVGGLALLVVVAAALWWSKRRLGTEVPTYVPSRLFHDGVRVRGYVDARAEEHPHVCGVVRGDPDTAFLAVPRDDAAVPDVPRALHPLEKRLQGLGVEVVPGWVVVTESPAVGQLLQDREAVRALARKVGARVRSPQP